MRKGYEFKNSVKSIERLFKRIKVQVDRETINKGFDGMENLVFGRKLSNNKEGLKYKEKLY